jgi:broad specificity phosphatase PhoE
MIKKVALVMKILLIRHLKVISKRAPFLTAKQFDDDRILYDKAEIEATQFKIKTEDYPVCYVSTVKRAVETAKMIYEGKYILSEDLVEVRNAGVFLKMSSLPAFFRSLIGRLAWYFNYSKMPETRIQSEARAKIFVAEMLSLENKNTLIITHGFYMHCLKRELRKHGFRGKVSLFPKNGHPYVFER